MCATRRDDIVSGRNALNLLDCSISHTREYSTSHRIFCNVIKLMVHFECCFTIHNDDWEKNFKAWEKKLVLFSKSEYSLKNLLLEWHHNNYILCLHWFTKIKLTNNFLLSKVTGSKGNLLQTAFCISAVTYTSISIATSLD